MRRCIEIDVMLSVVCCYLPQNAAGHWPWSDLIFCVEHLLSCSLLITPCGSVCQMYRGSKKAKSGWKMIFSVCTFFGRPSCQRNPSKRSIIGLTSMTRQNQLSAHFFSCYGQRKLLGHAFLHKLHIEFPSKKCWVQYVSFQLALNYLRLDNQYWHNVESSNFVQ